MELRNSGMERKTQGIFDFADYSSGNPVFKEGDHQIESFPEFLSS
jgi:hypothetical protein